MSGGLCFLIRVPTEDCERDIVDSRRKTLPTPDSTTESNTQNNHDTTNSSKSDSTEVKTKIPDPLEKELRTRFFMEQTLQDRKMHVIFRKKPEQQLPLPQVLRKSLEELRVFDALWVLDKDERFYQVSFTCSPGLPSDLILTSLATSGIGMCRGSSLVVLPCTVWLQDDEDSTQGSKDTDAKYQFICDDEKKSESDVSTLSKTKSEVRKAFRNFKDMQKKFLKTVTARLTVAQVVDGVRAGAEPTFDFIMFVLIASMIAALGLLENSSVIIVASMLISPIMGPIMAGTFGAVIRDRSLRNLGIKTEVLGLFLCVFIGFIFGLSAEAINTVWGRRDWPNSEMISRGQERSLWIGVLVALPSGAGVALSVLGGNAGSLVGVAISASLLPPAVNAGLVWGMATVRTARAQDEEFQFVRVESLMRLMKPSLVPPLGYEVNYYPEMDKECAMLGLVSLALALINIVCIFLAALVVLKIKEVAPKTSMSKTSRFWKEDIKIARDYNASMPISEAEELGNQFLAEWATLNGLEPEMLLSDDAEAAITRMETLKDILQDVESDEVFQTVARSVSSVTDPRPLSQRISFVPLAAGGGSPHNERKSGVRNWIRSSRQPQENIIPDPTLSPELKDVELRRPHPHNAGTLMPPLRQSGTRSSVALLRQSLVNADNPYTLWPSTTPESAVNKVRFLVTPVEEEPIPPLTIPTSPTRRRVSKFLQDPCVILKETTC